MTQSPNNFNRSKITKVGSEANVSDSNNERSNKQHRRAWFKSIDWSQGFSLARSARFDRDILDPFGVGAPQTVVLQAGSFLGDTRRGGSCNVNQVTWIPHCHGTHTESISHIVDELVPAYWVVPDRPIRARVVTMTPCQLNATHETYAGRHQDTDLVLTQQALAAAWNRVQSLRPSAEPDADTDLVPIESLVVFTGWNQACEPTNAGSAPSPFFTNEAMRWLVEQGIQHLLVEAASVDRLEDDGQLLNHRIFWQVATGEKTIGIDSRRGASITELIERPASTPDGDYAMILSVLAWPLDAAPSRPNLFPMFKHDVEI